MDENQKTDEELVALVQSGQVELFGILIVRYEKKMHRYASRTLGNFSDVQDVVQEVFIKAYKNIQSFDIKRKFSSWLYRIAHNEIVNAFKKKKGKNLLPIFDLDIFFPHSAKTTPDMVEKIEKEEMQKMANGLLDQLEEKYKEPIVLYFIEDLNYREIAEVMHLPIATVGIRIKRAKEKLKALTSRQKFNKF